MFGSRDPEYYFDRNRVASGSRETMRDAAQRAWRADLDAGRQTLLIVPTNEDVVALNLQARAQRLTRGDVDPDRAVDLHDGTAASVGDWIVTRENNRRLAVFAGADFVKNGDTSPEIGQKPQRCQRPIVGVPTGLIAVVGLFAGC